MREISQRVRAANPVQDDEPIDPLLLPSIWARVETQMGSRSRDIADDAVHSRPRRSARTAHLLSAAVIVAAIAVTIAFVAPESKTSPHRAGTAAPSSPPSPEASTALALANLALARFEPPIGADQYPDLPATLIGPGLAPPQVDSVEDVHRAWATEQSAAQSLEQLSGVTLRGYGRATGQAESRGLDLVSWSADSEIDGQRYTTSIVASIAASGSGSIVRLDAQVAWGPWIPASVSSCALPYIFTTEGQPPSNIHTCTLSIESDSLSLTVRVGTLIHLGPTANFHAYFPIPQPVDQNIVMLTASTSTIADYLAVAPGDTNLRITSPACVTTNAGPVGTCDPVEVHVIP
jgi:hypothetical protein